MNDQHQAELLEQFIFLLKQDGAAAPPAGLDPALAEFARKLVRASRQTPPGESARARVWARALAAIRQPSANGKSTLYNEDYEENPSVIAAQVRTRQAHPLPLIAAALALAVFGALIAFAQRPGLPGGMGDANLPAFVQNDATPTLIPTLAPTGTPILVSSVQAAEVMILQATPASAQPDVIFWQQAIPPGVEPPDILFIAQDIAPQGAVNGALTPDQPQVFYRFIAPQNMALTTILQAQGITHPLLQDHVINAYGIASSTNGGTGGALSSTLNLSKGDVVVLTVTSESGAEQGVFTLQLTPLPFEIPLPAPTMLPFQPFAMAQPAQPTRVQALPANFEEITLNTVIEGELNPDKPIAGYHLTAPRTGLIHMNITSDELTSFGMSSFIQRNGSGGGGGGGAQPGTAIGLSSAFFVYEGDDITLTVDNQGSGETGVFTLEVVHIDPTPVQYNDAGEVVENTLTADVPSAAYAFDGEAGDVITVRVEGEDGFDTSLELYGDDPAFMQMDRDSGAGYDPELYRVRLPETGTYWVAVKPMTGGGTFRLWLTKEATPSLDAGAQRITFNRNESPQLTFSGTAGETVRLNVRLPDDAAPTNIQRMSVHVWQHGSLLAVFDRGGGLNSMVAGGAPLVSGDITIPADGTVTVTLDALPQLTESGSLALDVSLERLS